MYYSLVYNNLIIINIQQNDFINTRVVCWVAKFMSKSHSCASSAHGQFYNSQMIFGKSEISCYTWIEGEFNYLRNASKYKTSTFRAKALRCVRSSQRGSKTKYVLLENIKVIRWRKIDQSVWSKQISVNIFIEILLNNFK